MKKTDYNTKITEMQNKISEFSGLISNITLHTKVTKMKKNGKIGNEQFDTAGLIIKTDCK